MSRTLALMTAAGGASALAGIALLVRPGSIRRMLSVDESDGAAYALRIIGAMLFAAGLFMGGFAIALTFTR
jgi:uncharacterized protein YjeT (DUF2065 family)